MFWKHAADVDFAGIVAAHELWWQGKLNRPVIQAVLIDTAAAMTNGLASKSFLPRYGNSVNADELLQREYAFTTTVERYACDGYPLQWMNFGPGVLAALVGGEGHCSTNTVWFDGGRLAGRELSELHIRFDPDAPWSQWLASLYRSAAEHQAERPCVLGMTDLGGVLDVLASLRGTENLLMDLIDSPDEVKRLLAEEGEAWRAAYSCFDGLSRAGSQANAVSCWAGILSPRRCYMLQSDFSYMISPEMFAEFTAPELILNCRFLDHAFYHLDGKKQLAHLPQLLSMPGLAGIQWIPGDGEPPQCEWPEVLEAIEEAGLKLQLLGSLKNVETALRRMKRPELAHVLLRISPDERERTERLIRDFS